MRVKLSEVCKIEKGKTGITKAINGEYPLVTTGEERQSHNAYDFDCRAVCVPLVSATGHGHASIKRLHYQEGKFALGTILAAVIPNNEEVLDAEYLYIYLSKFKDSLIVPLMKGSANVSLTIKALGTVELVLPDISLQREIVEIVNNIESKKDDIAQVLEEQSILVGKLRNQILQQAIQGKLVPQDANDEPAAEVLKRIQEEKEQLIKEKKIKKEKALPEITDEEKPFELPDGWEWTRVGEIVQLTSGRDVSPQYCNDKGIGVPYILGASNIQGKEFIKERWIENPVVLCKEKDLLLSCKGTIGKTIIIDEPINLSRQIMSLRGINNLDIHYLKIFIDSYVVNLKEISKGLIPGISREDILSVCFALPPLKEQQRIVERVDQLMTLCDKLEEQVKASKVKNEQLLKAILQQHLQ